MQLRVLLHLGRGGCSGQVGKHAVHLSVLGGGQSVRECVRVGVCVCACVYASVSTCMCVCACVQVRVCV